MAQPRWIGIAASLLLVVSVTAGVVRAPTNAAREAPIAGPASDVVSSTGSGDPTVTGDAATPAPAITTDPTPILVTPSSEPAEPDPTSNRSLEEAAEASPEALAFGPWAAASAGRYLYATDGTSGLDGEERRLPDRTTLRVSDPGRDGFQARVRDLRDDEGYGQLVAYDLHVREGGIELSRITTATRVRLLAGRTDTRTFAADPPGTLVSTDDHAGSSHQFTLFSGATTIAVTILIEGIESVSIDDVDVDAVVVEQHLVFDGEIEGATTTRAWLQLGDLLLLREQVDADITSRGVRHVTRYSAELTSLAPA